MPSVAILLCTFNGARFLPDQLASFADQEFADWRLFASDDGSTDETAAILAEFGSRRQAQLTLRRGPRQGFVHNFLSLACDRTIAADYYAYSDQDDIWEPDKLSRAADWLRQCRPDVPALYCSRTRLIDERGRERGLSPLFRRKPHFRNALVQNIAGGNTMVFNEAARRLLQASGATVSVPAHDWWTYLLITAAGGAVHFDPVPTIDYREHADNVIGVNAGWFSRINRMQMLADSQFRHWSDLNIAALEPIRHLMTPENRNVYDRFRAWRMRGFIGRQIGFCRTGIYRQTLFGNMSLLLAVWAGKI